MATKKPASAGKRTAPTPRKSRTAAKKPTTKVTSRAAAASSRSYFAGVGNFMKAPLMAASAAEFIGTFLLAAVGLIVWNADPNYTLFTLIPIVLVVVAMSGAHLNPLVTFGALATRRVSLTRASAYIVAQVLGAFVAFAMMTGFVNAVPDTGSSVLQQSSPSLFKAAEVPKNSEWLLVSAELVGAVIFAFAVASALKLGKTGVAYALTYAGGLYVALIVVRTVTSYVNGTAILNPALAGPFQALSWQVWPIVVYVVAPLVGGVIGFALNDLLQKKEVITR